MAKKTTEKQYFEAVGRRKNAVALVRLYITGKEKSVTLKSKKIGQGDIIINEKPMAEIFSTEVDRKKCILPLELTNTMGRFAISIKTSGGGQHGQLEAIMHGISRALVKIEAEDHKIILKEHDLLTRDPRTRERRKVGTGGKARRAKQSPKR